MTRLVHDKQELSVLQLICGGSFFFLIKIYILVFTCKIKGNIYCGGSLEGTLAVIKRMNSNRVLLVFSCQIASQAVSCD